MSIRGCTYSIAPSLKLEGTMAKRKKAKAAVKKTAKKTAKRKTAAKRK